ncbi:hypothetical protein J1614_005141, partial [Plenodomus biglobosus]
RSAGCGAKIFRTLAPKQTKRKLTDCHDEFRAFRIHRNGSISSNITTLGPQPSLLTPRRPTSFAMSDKSHRLYVKGKHISQTACSMERTANRHTATSEGTTTRTLHADELPLTITRKRNTNPGTSLLKLEGVDDSKAAQWYADVYRAQRAIQGSKIRVIWGKVTRPHGNSGVVRAKFRSNLPPKSFGASVRVMLYPSSI